MTEPLILSIFDYKKLRREQPGLGNGTLNSKKWRYKVKEEGVEFAAPRWDIMTVTVEWDEWKKNSTVIMYTPDGQFGRIPYSLIEAKETSNVVFFMGPGPMDKVAVHLPSVENNIIVIP